MTQHAESIEDAQGAQAALVAAERELRNAEASNHYAGTTGGRSDRVERARKAVKAARRQAKAQSKSQAQDTTMDEGSGALAWTVFAVMFVGALIGWLWVATHVGLF